LACFSYFISDLLDNVNRIVTSDSSSLHCMALYLLSAYHKIILLSAVIPRYTL